jgi:hypothetical protein
VPPDFTDIYEIARVKLSPGTDESVLPLCTLCGALVFDTVTHSRFHRSLHNWIADKL